MSLATVMTRLKTAVESVSGVGTVYVGPVEVPATGNTMLPAVILDVVNISIQPSTVSVWTYAIDLYWLQAERGKVITTDLAAELTTLYPKPSAVVDRLNANATLAGMVYGMSFGDPAVDGPGVIAWRDRTYTGFVMHLLLKEKFATAFAG